MLDETAVDEDGHMPLNAFGGNARGGGDLRHIVAGVGNKASKDDALGGVDALDGTDFTTASSESMAPSSGTMYDLVQPPKRRLMNDNEITIN